MIFTELILTHYSEPGRSPLHSITALAEEEAMRLAAELAPTTRSPKNRFCAEDFPGYYAERIMTEQWLYGAFCEKGGKPETEHPLYLVLGESEFLHGWFGSGDVYTMPITAADRGRLSFTVGDSMSAVRRPDREVLTAGELEHMLERAGGLAGLLAQTGVHYIEAQLWQTAPPTELVPNERNRT